MPIILLLAAASYLKAILVKSKRRLPFVDDFIVKKSRQGKFRKIEFLSYLGWGITFTSLYIFLFLNGISSHSNKFYYLIIILHFVIIISILFTKTILEKDTFDK